MPQTTVSIERPNNSSTLYGTLYHPPSKAKAYALFAHSFTAMGSKAAHIIPVDLVQNGIGVLSIDITGTLDTSSQQKAKPLTLEDIRLCCRYLKAHYFTPQLLIGHGIASPALLSIVPELPEVRAVASISTPLNLKGKDISKTSSDLFSESVAVLRIDKSSLSLDTALVQLLQQQKILKQLKELPVPLLLLHSPEDTAFSYHDIVDILPQLPQTSSLVSIDAAEHQLSSPSQAQFCASILSSWSNRYLFKHSHTTEIFGSKNQDTISTIVNETGKSTYQLSCRLGNHYMYSDLPKQSNGSNTGPSPVQLLHSALGTSASITMRNHALQKGWDLEHIRIQVRQEKNTHNADADIPSSEYIILEIYLGGSLDNIQRNALVDVVKNSPVHKQLATKILTRLQSTSPPT